jgi:hypothetical protein
MYKSDEAIANEFNGMNIINVKVNASNCSGIIEVNFPNGGEHCGGGTDYVCDNWIKYDNGKIAFSYWYPEQVYFKLVNVIENALYDFGRNSI